MKYTETHSSSCSFNKESFHYLLYRYYTDVHTHLCITVAVELYVISERQKNWNGELTNQTKPTSGTTKKQVLLAVYSCTYLLAKYQNKQAVKP